MSLLSPFYEDRVRKFYDELTEDQQHLLKLYVALYDEISASALIKRLTAMGHTKSSGKRYVGDDVKALFAAIKRGDLGASPPGRALQMSRELSAWVGALVSEEEEPFGRYAVNMYLQSGTHNRFVDPYGGRQQRALALSHGHYWDANEEVLHLTLIRESNYGDPTKVLELPLLGYVHYPFCQRRFEGLPDEYRTALIPEIHDTQAFQMVYYPAWTGYLRSLENVKHRAMLGDMLLLAGDFEGAGEVAEELCEAKGKLRKVEGLFLKGVVAFLSGDQEGAARCIEQGIQLKGSSLRVTLATEALVGLFLFTRDEAVFQNALANMKEKKRSNRIARVLEVLQAPDERHPGQGKIAFDGYLRHQAEGLSELGQIIAMHAWIWKGVAYTRDMAKLLKEVLEESLAQEAPLIGAMTVNFLRQFKVTGLPKVPVEIVELLPLKKELEAWEKQLVELERFALAQHPDKVVAKKAAVEKKSRLIWEVVTSSAHDYVVDVVPKEQQPTKRGEWTRGRAVSLGRLREEASNLPFVAPEDLKVIQKIRPSGWSANQYDLHCDDALFELVGHPNVYREGGHDVPVEVVKHSLKFILSDEASGDVGLTVQPSLGELEFNRNGVSVWWETPVRIGVIKISKEESHLVHVLSLDEGPAQIPAAGKDRLINVIQALKDDVNVFTDVEAAGEASVQVIEPNLMLQLHLAPHGEGLRAALRVQPITEVETFLTPGTGSQVVFAEVNGQPSKTLRPLAEEMVRASEIIEACPSLCENEEGDPFLWALPEPIDCLELLTEAMAVKDRLEVRWPQGERFRLAAEAASKQVRLKVTSSKDWFQLSGELEVGEGEVLQLQELLDLLEKDDSLGRFVKLRDGQFLALTREFRQRLAEVDAFTTEGKGGSRRMNPLAAHALTEFTEEAQTKLNKKWIAHVERLREAADYKAELPSTLQAELRPYQLEGFQWLARQAEWGVGACLADDMGLGKTLQALALLLHRATLGPALVVAPTSVTRNWLSEAMKFAPTLRTHLFGPGNRAATLSELQPFDVVVCTYGLLPIEIESLEKVSWSTIVLDEAQSIKNASTQRWKAAVRLQGDCKVITTGTPIENHLAELHALFQFINPGLLGSAQRFHVKFADPIAKQREDGARMRLKRLIRPFILRRLKNQVLQDLPPRTDIVLQVEPSSEETAFYEALRRKALKNLTKGKDDDENAGERSLRILAEIMKLRRACCHPQLVDAKIPLGSSKLELFAQTIAEVLGNGHKALVFSQFVDHLAFIRDHLDKVGISYQYLDGKTPSKKRQEAVDAFQRGEGDVFLISLRAGGTGLNLTAADYVIHMDPWWNPAVEDQASDRAHRIGQQRPVTVYRLVVANTIEEKIVQLHHQKRDLADSLLSGAETAGKLSPEQLLNLLKDER